MHIEPGILSGEKVAYANAVASVLVVGIGVQALRRPRLLLRALLAATFFSLFMQAFHMKVGPSELHFIGALPIYLALGPLPTVLGFALGLLMQGLLFEPADLVHLGVNFLSLAVPLAVMHFTGARHLAMVGWRDVLRLDAIYYAGVVLMVGFWLALGEEATPFAAWLHFASTYLAIIALEPAVSIAVLKLLGRWQNRRVMRVCFDLRRAL